jgi:hypothetical protein
MFQVNKDDAGNYYLDVEDAGMQEIEKAIVSLPSNVNFHFTEFVLEPTGKNKNMVKSKIKLKGSDTTHANGKEYMTWIGFFRAVLGFEGNNRKAKITPDMEFKTDERGIPSLVS